MNKVLTIIMAGGQGTRLSVLADRRAKPAVPFCGIYRIIDFALSNAMHSGSRSLGVVTQYRPYSLADHIGMGEWWGFAGFGRKAKILSPHTGDRNASFYCNTADAIYHNIEFIQRFPEATDVLILSGDHIYKMDYRPMIDQHRQSGALLTLATQEVPWEETSRFGIMVCDDTGRIVKFQEKPKVAPLSNKASLGIYVFNRDELIRELRDDQANPDSSHDFGNDIIPKLIDTGRVFNYDFRGYWRDVGTIQSYVETSMEALDPNSGLNLTAWGVRTNHREIPLSHQHPAQIARGASVQRSLISKGTKIHGSVVESILSPGVVIAPGASVRRSIILHGAQIGEGCVLEDVIVDKGCVIGDGTRLGDPSLGDDPNHDFSDKLNHGTSVIGQRSHIGPGLTLGRNCLVYPDVTVEQDCGWKVPAGSTFYREEE